MRRLVAAFGAACFCVSAFTAGMAQAETNRAWAGTNYRATEAAKVAAKKSGKADSKATKSAGKVAKKRVVRTSAAKGSKRKTVIDKDGVVAVGKLKTFDSMAGFPKVENPLAASVGTGYSGMINSYAKAYGVPVELAHAVVRVESNFNPKARGSAGEIGLMQIKPATARMMGYSGSSKGLYDPETNIKYGMKYLAMAHDLGGGTTCGTILKYNAGHAAKRMNPVSKRYCGKIQSIID